MSSSPPAAWSLVVPVKRLSRAKTRLARLAGAHRPELALAFAQDTVSAALTCRAVAHVVVVTDDARAADALGALGAEIVSDEPDAGLNPALRHGARHAAGRRPGLGVGALSADLPALRPAELARALDAAALARRAFVADAAGDGTTLLTAAPGVSLAPSFGASSRTRHATAGAYELDLEGIPTLRRDVDTEADLRDAVRLGLGPHTAAAVGLLTAAPGEACPREMP